MQRELRFRDSFLEKERDLHSRGKPSTCDSGNLFTDSNIIGQSICVRGGGIGREREKEREIARARALFIQCRNER